MPEHNSSGFTGFRSNSNAIPNVISKLIRKLASHSAKNDLIKPNPKKYITVSEKFRSLARPEATKVAAKTTHTILNTLGKRKLLVIVVINQSSPLEDLRRSIH